MNDENNQLAHEDARKELIREQVAQTELHLEFAEAPAPSGEAIAVPLGQIASMGTAFASVPEVFRTVTQTVQIPNDGTLLRACTKGGAPLNIAQLWSANDGSGALGAIRGAKLAQARFFAAGPQVATVSATIPFDPTMVALAIALQQVTQKLDAIQKTVDDMFEYMRQRDKSKMRGNLQTLVDIINGYGVNADNATYMQNAHLKAMDIQSEARQGMDFYRSNVERKLAGKAPIELRAMVEERLDDVLDSLKDYQLSLYIFAFASFLDPLLCENFKRERLEGVAKRIQDEAIRYREAYSKACNVIEESAKRSADSAVLGGLAAAGHFLGGAIATTPLGEATGIDEALEGAGKGLEGFNKGWSERLLEKLYAAKSPDVLPFQESVEKMNHIYNDSTELLTDGETLYLVPASE